jgi:hypothetical protein
MYDRYFTLLEAQQLVPALEEILKGIGSTQPMLEVRDVEFRVLAEKINASGGLRVDLDHWSSQQLHREALATRIARDVATLQEMGVVLKDVGKGLVDFPSFLENEEVFLCWKSGEKQIQYWHRMNEGYANRKPFTADALSSSLKNGNSVQ